MSSSTGSSAPKIGDYILYYPGKRPEEAPQTYQIIGERQNYWFLEGGIRANKGQCSSKPVKRKRKVRSDKGKKRGSRAV